MEKVFTTKIYSLDKIGNERFIIPSYQRPYVWGDEQINKLLSDFYDAYLRNDTHYFIGTVLTSKKGELEELIDGQQRFTTLWLISVSFKIIGIESSLQGFLKSDDSLRFDFAIRKQLKSYLLSLLEKTKNDKNQYSNKEIENDEYLINVAKAVTTITKKLETLTFDNGKTIHGFGNYIFKNIQFVKNTAPVNTNLNKLFSTINNSGVQLEQSDILKSRLMHLIAKGTANKPERILYSKIWEACENMENYFERNVRKLFPRTQWLAISKDDFAAFNINIFKFKEDDNHDNTGLDKSILELSDLLGTGSLFQKSEIDKLLKQDDGEEDDPEKVYCRSIINFSQLLLHTYRIYLARTGRADFEQPFHIKHLLDIFKSLEKEGEEYIKGFILCLWEVRFAFDKHIIKWVQKSEDKEEELKVTTVSSSDKNGNRFFSRSQPESKDAITMLQSVLYFTGNYNTQIWLSPFLKRILDGENAENCLEYIDNELSLSLEEDKPTSFSLMSPLFSVANKLNFESYLIKPNGTSFKHYWFQKIEYLLWKQMKIKDDWAPSEEEKFRRFRITSKNSVEHIFPQQPDYLDPLNKEHLDNFGNLVLLSVSQNSEYSRKDVNVKREEFKAKPTFDSLKSYIIFNSYKQLWNEETIDLHREEMISLLRSHYILKQSYAQLN